MLDVIIRNGRLLDGTGSPWFRVDAALIRDRIAAVGHLMEREAALVIDATDRFVAPGFVEEHRHADVTLLVDPLAQSAVRQGVTTMAVGLCGMSAAPVSPEQRDAYRHTTPVFSFAGYEWTWNTMGEYLDTLRAVRPSVNVVALAGHEPLRASTMNQVSRPANPQERSKMCEMLERALAEGARGFSTGLTYSSAIFADAPEIVELARALRPYGWAYHTHMRDYGSHLLDAIRDAIDIAEKAKVPLVISHMEPSGRDHWGKAKAALELLEQARSRGLEVGYDVAPWLRGGGPIDQMFPPLGP